MSGMRQRGARLAGALLMAALLLVPLAASAHAHRTDASARSCAACIAAHHSPVIVGAAVAPAVTLMDALARPVPPEAVPTHPQRSPRAGRAPPAISPVRIG